MRPEIRSIRYRNEGLPVLCLHGFTGTPFSFGHLTKYLGNANWNIYAPVLAGHGGTLDDLAKTQWSDWYASADEALTNLVAARGKPVSIVGYSMGALLALELALNRPDDVDALVLMAAPLRLPKWQAVGLRVLRTLLPRKVLHHPRLSWPKSAGPDVSVNVPHVDDHSLEALPIGAANSLLDLAAQVRSRLDKVEQPTLVVHSMADPVVPFSASEELVDRLIGTSAEYYWLIHSQHKLCLDVDRKDVFLTVEDFLARHH